MAKSKNRNFPPKNFWVGVGCYQNWRGGIDNRIWCEKYMKIGLVKLQLLVGEVLRLQWPNKLDFSPFWTACQIWLELGTKLKLGNFFHWAIVYKSAENGPDGIVTAVAKWRQSRHFVPKSAALTGGWGPENAWIRSTFSRHTTSEQIVWYIVCWKFL